jgi:hypothetical protein
LVSTLRMLSFASFMCCNGFNELGLETILLFKCKTESEHKCYIQVNRHTFGRRFLVELGANYRPDAPAMQGENRMIGELSQVQLRMGRGFCFVQSLTKEYVQQVAHYSYWNPSKTQLNRTLSRRLLVATVRKLQVDSWKRLHQVNPIGPNIFKLINFNLSCYFTLDSKSRSGHGQNARSRELANCGHLCQIHEHSRVVQQQVD